jgi:uncharacterized protein with PIN domain
MNLSFLVDGMLGDLNKWLRICGFKTTYLGNIQDDKLLNVAKKNGLTILTRDKNLIRKAQKAGIIAFTVQGKKMTEGLASVVKHFGLKLNAENSMCTKCGSELQLSNKHLLKNKVPARSYDVYEKFWVCSICGKIFWRGSHWKRIQKTMSEVSQLLDASKQTI